VQVAKTAKKAWLEKQINVKMDFFASMEACIIGEQSWHSSSQTLTSYNLMIMAMVSSRP
jgi:hypothetical protein